MYIRVRPPDGAVQISAPLFVEDAAIRMFAASKLSWIERQRQRFGTQCREMEKQYGTGESCYVWGRRYVLDVRQADTRKAVCILGDKLIMQVRGESTAAQREAMLNEWYREQLKQAIPGILEGCEQTVGVKANEWQVKNMRTKWGTCNVAEKRIWLNLQLAKKTPACLAYVITHELVHLLERDHNEQFRQYMDRFFPNWRTVKRVLNEQQRD